MGFVCSEKKKDFQCVAIWYKELGGKYSGRKTDGTLTRWYKEEWQSIAPKDNYPVFRPTIRVNAKTPLTASEIDPISAKKQIKLKQKIKGKKNLPAFE